MQKERQIGTSLFRGFFRCLLALGTVFGSLYLSLVAFGLLLRLKPVNDRVRLLSKRLNTVARWFAETRVGNQYFNMAMLKHVGRKSGRDYRTPLSTFPLGDGFVFVLTYGPNNTDWCRNVMASGKCTLIWQGQEYVLDKPEVLPLSEAWEAYPLFARPFMRAVGMKQCLWLHKQSVVTKEHRMSWHRSMYNLM